MYVHVCACAWFVHVSEKEDKIEDKIKVVEGMNHTSLSLCVSLTDI